MYVLNLITASTVEHCEDYASVEDAVHDAVAMWLEGSDGPRPQVLDDAKGNPIVTFVPIGSLGDAVLVVYNTTGQTEMWANLAYRTNPENGRIDKTTGICNGIWRTLNHKS